MPRLFTGIEIPTSTRETLARLKGGLPGARWVDPDNYHITLRFLGDVDGRTASEAAELLRRVSRPIFSVGFDRISSFGTRKPHAIISRIVHSQELTDLHSEHERLMRRLGLPPETRKYIPHVTLARLKGAIERDIAAYLAQSGPAVLPPFAADRFVLFSARDSVGGGPHVVEEAYPLSAGDGAADSGLHRSTDGRLSG